MVESEQPIEIAICMGSSCFSRGNSKNLALIQDYLRTNKVEAAINLVGHLCQDECKEGPNLAIGGHTYHRVDSAALATILQRFFSKDDACPE